ncbi:MAG TPA: cyclase family protein [Terriglobia bacterium]|nr:cyclase family protein [Terriglobia bacterium]
MQSPIEGIRSGRMRVVDLTHTLDEHSPYWPEKVPGTPFRASTVATYQQDGCFTRNLAIPEHFGTHIDAPAHFDPQGETIAQIPADKFLSPAVTIDVSAAAKSDADYRVRASDVQNWIGLHGRIPLGALVLIRTGWDERWPSQARYMNTDAVGVMHFPGLSVEAAHYLLDHTHPAGIGIDTASIDAGSSTDFPVHHLTLLAGLYHLENVANLSQLPPKGFSTIALPLKLGGGSGSPARVLALLPGEASSSD